MTNTHFNLLCDWVSALVTRHSALTQGLTFVYLALGSVAILQTHQTPCTDLSHFSVVSRHIRSCL